MNKKIKTAVIGVGYLGEFHAQKYAEIDRSDLVAVVDTSLDRASEIASKYGCRAVDNHRELLGQVDAVSVVTPTIHHYQIAKDFLEQGAHVLVEKPIAATLDQGHSLVRLAQQKNLILSVGHLVRFDAVLKQAMPLIKKPRFLEVHRLSPFPLRSTDIDVVLDLMIHDLDLAIELVGSPIREIRASGVAVLSNTPDIANARVAFENGAVANLTASRVSLNRVRKFRIFQEDRYLSLDFISNQLEQAWRQKTESGEVEIQYDRQEVAAKDHLKTEVETFLKDVDAASKSSDITMNSVSGEAGVRALEAALQVMEQICNDDNPTVI